MLKNNEGVVIVQWPEIQDLPNFWIKMKAVGFVKKMIQKVLASQTVTWTYQKLKSPTCHVFAIFLTKRNECEKKNWIKRTKY